ncbi:MAG: Flp family type IVb pilin [Firmicutes bacterium]|nr:Flp family type IVb pilin [Bacillota bacterium]
MNKRGQALVEYILIIALISVIAISLVNYLGGYLKDAITKTSCSLVDEEYFKGNKPGEAYCSGDLDKKTE